MTIDTAGHALASPFSADGTRARGEAQIGRAVRRREDDALVTGQGCYVADVPLDKPLHVAFVRSPMPAGEILSCDGEGALDMAGVAGFACGEDVRHLGRLSVNPVLTIEGEAPFPVLARGRVAAVGQPVAAVFAESRALAQDAADMVMLDIGDVQDGPSLDGDARISGHWREGDVEAAMASAAHVVEVRVEHPRLAPSPLEPRGIAVAFDAATESVTVWYSTQTPHRARRELCRILGVEEARIAVKAPDVGGAFGMKASLYPEEVLCVWAAFRFRRDMRWIASRAEDLLSASHGRGATSRGRLAVDAEGRFLALSAEIECPLGHWLPSSAAIPPWNAGAHPAGRLRARRHRRALARPAFQQCRCRHLSRRRPGRKRTA